VNKRIAFNSRIAELQQQVNRLRRDRDLVSVDEFKEVVRSLHQIERNKEAVDRHARDLATQFTRMAHLQADVDELKRALKKAKLLD